MRPRFAICIALALLLTPGPTHAKESWAKLRLGMTAAQTAAVLGEPVLRTAGQGFELWIYDHSGEAVFYGPLIGWTTPATGNAPVGSVDVWQNGGGQPPGEAVVLAQPAGRRSVSRNPSRSEAENRLPSYRQR